MLNIFNNLFGKSQPVRRTVKLRQTFDADGQPVIVPEHGDATVLSPEGSFDGALIDTDRFLHCGCKAEGSPGGQCGEPGCGRISCARCFLRCDACFKPLCLEHVKVFQPDTGTPRKLCVRCHSQQSRQQRLRSAARFLLNPFISFDENK